METRSPMGPASSVDSSLTYDGGIRHPGANHPVELLGRARQPVAGRAGNADELEDAPSSSSPEHECVASWFELDLVARRQAKSIADALRDRDLSFARNASSRCGHFRLHPLAANETAGREGP